MKKTHIESVVEINSLEWNVLREEASLIVLNCLYVA